MNGDVSIELLQTIFNVNLKGSAQKGSFTSEWRDTHIATKLIKTGEAVK